MTIKTDALIYSTHTEAENAVKELQRSGFDMRKLSIMGSEYHTEEYVLGYYNTVERMIFWGRQGAFWGALWGILLGSTLFLPPIGQLAVAGNFVSFVVAGLQGAVTLGALSMVAAGIYSIGIPRDSIIRYKTSIRIEQFSLLVHGSAEELAKAVDILTNMNLKVPVHSA